MKFLVITHAIHKNSNNKYFAYAPFVREMNLWGSQIEKMTVLAPISSSPPQSIDLSYSHPSLDFLPIPNLNFTSFLSVISSIYLLPSTIWKVFMAMKGTDHIHLRCPGNIGLIGCLIQIFFPKKPKTAKYAGNWDWKSQQPWSYRLQQVILRNTFLTRNITVLVYGNWSDRSSNISPFFTASYSKDEAIEKPPRPLNRETTIKLIFVGTLTTNKRPLLAVETAAILKQKGFKIQLDLYGEGPEKETLKTKIFEKDLQKEAFLHGNVSAEILKIAYQEAHFLLFASQSEGWPKAVAESMFWGCLPITTSVSCVPQMLGNGSRGNLVIPDAFTIVEVIEAYCLNTMDYMSKCQEAMNWSRQYTLEFFKAEIFHILKNGKSSTSH